MGVLRAHGSCRLDRLIRIIENEIAPKWTYFPWQLRGPRGLEGRSWKDSEVLETCLKFLEEKGLNTRRYNIKLRYDGKYVSKSPLV